MIGQFRGDYALLSNFYLCEVPYMGFVFGNAEAAFQAAKCPEMARDFVYLNPSQAKSKGRKVPLRSDWETIKDDVMYAVLKAKFDANPDLRVKLLETGDQELQEGNTWNDTYWGVCNGHGRNMLGKLLMKLRFELSIELSRADPKWV